MILQQNLTRSGLPSGFVAVYSLMTTEPYTILPFHAEVLSFLWCTISYKWALISMFFFFFFWQFDAGGYARLGTTAKSSVNNRTTARNTASNKKSAFKFFSKLNISTISSDPPATKSGPTKTANFRQCQKLPCRLLSYFARLSDVELNYRVFDEAFNMFVPQFLVRFLF